MTDAAPPPTSAPPASGEVTLESGAEGFGAAETQATALGIRVQTQFGDLRRRFLRNKLAVVGLVMVAIVFLTALIAPVLAPHDPQAQDLSNTLDDRRRPTGWAPTSTGATCSAGSSTAAGSRSWSAWRPSCWRW